MPNSALKQLDVLQSHETQSNCRIGKKTNKHVTGSSQAPTWQLITLYEKYLL